MSLTDYYGLTAAARQLGVGRNVLRYGVRRGLLCHGELGDGTIVVTLEDARAYVDTVDAEKRGGRPRKEPTR